MNKIKQRVTIAESTGDWTEIKYNVHNSMVGKRRGLEGWYYVPYYLGNLNAMHEVLKSLSTEQQVDLAHQLYNILGMHDHVEIEAIYASAEQLAEAYLKTIRMWEYE
ncbi:hypothetical protein N9955_00275 [bacterium]|nr:hypothetical protein [bacterium]